MLIKTTWNDSNQISKNLIKSLIVCSIGKDTKQWEQSSIAKGVNWYDFEKHFGIIYCSDASNCTPGYIP